MIVTGRVHRFGENVTTDDIIAGKYKHRTIDLDELAKHAMENVRPEFVDTVLPGDFIVAGRNFGCGSSREQAPAILRHIGITAVVAPSFARIFFRNAINIGLLLLAGDTDGINEQQTLEFDDDHRRLRVVETGAEVPVEAPPAEVQEILKAGGLLAYVRANGGL